MQHGRLKVKTTLEQQEAKQKERDKKLKVYTAGTDRLFQKRVDKEYDEEALRISAELLSANPDFYTLWNIRREILEHWKQNRDDVEVQLQSELEFLEQCLRVNPKSYGVWHQRAWVLVTLTEPDWKREIQLCNKFLEYDERNFHCWDHRRFIVKHAGVSDEDEFQFTTDKINVNFSDFSSWHYRSKLLPLLQPASNSRGHVKHTALLKEFELVQNAVFTDPNDQSAWFYHRWLLSKGEAPLSIDIIHVSKTSARLLVTLSRPVKLGKDVDLEVRLNGAVQHVTWKAAGQDGYCLLWMSHLPNKLIAEADDISVAVTTIQNLYVDENPIYLRINKDGNEFCYQNIDNEARSENGGARTAILSQELESCKQLLELEPDNKWTLLSVVSLLRNMKCPEDEIVECLEKLIRVDPMRCHYYLDLRSDCRTESALRDAQTDTQLYLQDRQLTKLSLPHRMVVMTTIDLSRNSIKCLLGAYFLQNVCVLNLASNRISCCDGLESLVCLQHLCLAANALTDVTSLKVLTGCTALQAIDVTDNPLLTVSSEQTHNMEDSSHCADDCNPVINRISQMFDNVSILSNRQRCQCHCL